MIFSEWNTKGAREEIEAHLMKERDRAWTARQKIESHDIDTLEYEDAIGERNKALRNIGVLEGAYRAIEALEDASRLLASNKQDKGAKKDTKRA